MINNLINEKKEKKKTLVMGPQDQHHEMGYKTASLIYEQCGGMRISLCWLMYKASLKSGENHAFMPLKGLFINKWFIYLKNV